MITAAVPEKIILCPGGCSFPVSARRRFVVENISANFKLGIDAEPARDCAWECTLTYK